MKATNSPSSAPLIIRLVGIILILTSLIDYISTLIPFSFSDQEWLARTVTQLVDRGIIPLVGLAFLFAGTFLERGSFTLPEHKSPILSFRFWALLFALLLGILFLASFPVHLNNTRQLSDQARSRISQQAGDAENQLNLQVQQRRDQIANALRDPNAAKKLDDELKQIEAALNSNQIQGNQRTQLEQARKELQALKANPEPNSIDQRAKQFRDERLTEIRQKREQLEGQAQSEFWKTGVRVGISSLLLSLAYFVTSISGLRELGVLKSKRKLPPR
jgi:hypothetical protein